MSHRVFLGNAAQQHNNFSEYQLGHTAGIRKRRIKHNNTVFFRRFKVDLVGTNTKTANRNEFFSCRKHPFIQLAARAYTDNVRVFNFLTQLVFAERGLQNL